MDISCKFRSITIYSLLDSIIGSITKDSGGAKRGGTFAILMFALVLLLEFLFKFELSLLELKYSLLDFETSSLLIFIILLAKGLSFLSC